MLDGQAVFRLDPGGEIDDAVLFRFDSDGHGQAGLGVDEFIFLLFHQLPALKIPQLAGEGFPVLVFGDPQPFG